MLPSCEHANLWEETMANTIGVIGLGNMGGGMAASLARAGYSVLGVDTVQEARDRASSAGVRVVPNIESLTAEADVILTMLPDSPDVEACMLGPGGIVESVRPDTLIIEASTIAPATTKAVAAALVAKGCAFIDAPVGRAPANAADGTLMFMVGAAPGDFDRAKPYLDAMGTDIHHCGPVGTGIAMKLVLNLLGQSTCQLSAEVMALGLKMGLSLETLHPILTGGIGRNGFIADYWPTKVLRGDTEPGFAIRLSAKDLRLAAAMAEEAGAPIPTGAAAAAAVNRAAETHGGLDVSGMLTVACENAGIKSTFG
jgi:4-hydroxybutyrate dehydrogenase/sulfolactaldehyde 3-reductase